MSEPLEQFASLRTTSEEHHARLMPHVDRLGTLAELVGHVDCDALHALFEEEYRFIVGQLVPHMETIERTLYDRIEAELDGRHSLAPMREEHRQMRALIEQLGQYRASRAGLHAGARSRGWRSGAPSTACTRCSRSTSRRRSSTSGCSSGASVTRRRTCSPAAWSTPWPRALAAGPPWRGVRAPSSR